jgi:hypothetical protein
MHSTFIISAIAFLAGSSQALVLPREQPSVADVAGGAPPNGPPPDNISDAAVADFQGVNFLENLEAAFFAEGLQNLTHLWDKDGDHKVAIDVVAKVHAQELIHIQTAENILNHFKKPTFTPCKYEFPVSNAAEFFALANIITSAGIGAVINVASGLALTDPTLVPGPASILAVEARHDAFFRVASVSNIPNPAPFDTRISAAYALNLASAFIVKGSCAAQPSFPVLPPLSAEVKTKTTGSSGPITFTFDKSQLKPSDFAKTLYIGWVNQANVVNYQAATVSNDQYGKVTTTIPSGMAGLAFAALTAQNTAKDVNSLTAVTLAGPAPVQIS